MMKRVEGARIYLRELAESDLDRTWEWLHRPDINDKIGVETPFTKQQQKEWFANLQEDGAKVVFAVCLRSDDTHVGNVSLDMIDRRHRNARFRIFIADESMRGLGLGSESIRLLEEYAFSTLGLHKIWCKTDAGSPEVTRFYEKLGFSQEGVLCQHELKGARYVDKILFGKLEPNR